MHYDDIILAVAKDAVVAVPAVAAAATFGWLDVNVVLTNVSLGMGILLMGFRFYFMIKDVVKRRKRINSE